MQPAGAFRRGRGAAIACAVAALFACATGGSSSPGDGVARIERANAAGLDLYAAGEYRVAARRFQDSGREARALRDREAEKRAVTAECASWLRARALEELADCTDRLGSLHRHAHRAAPGMGALLSLGAIAAERPLPLYRVSPDVAAVLRDAASAGEGL
jgi:hypothetical protein